MVRSLILLFVLAASCGWAHAQVSDEGKQSFLDQFFLDPTIVEALHPKHMPFTQGAFPLKDIDSLQDALSYELWMDWTMALTTSRDQRPPRKAESRMHIRMHVKDERTSIKLHGETLIIDSVSVDGESVQFSHERPNLLIQLGSIRMNDTVDIVIHYAISYDLRGFYAYSQAEADTIEEMLMPIAFTFSQPEDARYWMPCYDVPFDKAVFTVHTRVPSGYVVVSNGTRIDSTSDTDTTSWQTWYQPVPQAPYLTAVNASVYHRYDQHFVSVTGDTIPILNYHWLVDQDGGLYNAENALSNIPEMLRAFEEHYGAYPYETYGNVTIAGVKFGGMEHQTMSTISRKWLQGEAETGYAHEVAHMWLGDLVTCATWADIWLNEGGASFSEALWREHRGGPQAYLQHMLGRRARYMRTPFNEPAIYDIPIIIIFNEATTYSKSAWVYHMMRRMVGDDQFFPALRTYMDTYALGAAQTADMQRSFEASIPDPLVDWNTFFDQWLLGRGHPRLVVSAITSEVPVDTRFRSNVTVRQTQTGDGVPEAFHVPVTLRFVNVAEIYDTTLFITERTTKVELTLPFIPDSVIIDPNYDILSEGAGITVTSVDEETDAPFAEITGPLPLVGDMPLNIIVLPGSRIRVVNMEGRQLANIVEDSNLAIIDTRGWPSGLVSIVVERNNSTVVRTIPIVR